MDEWAVKVEPDLSSESGNISKLLFYSIFVEIPEGDSDSFTFHSALPVWKQGAQFLFLRNSLFTCRSLTIWGKECFQTEKSSNISASISRSQQASDTGLESQECINQIPPALVFFHNTRIMVF